MKSAKGFAAVMLLPVFFFLASCTKDHLENLDSDDTGIYITNRDSTVDFSTYATFSVADSVAVIEDNQLVEQGTSSFDQQLRSTFIGLMQQRGYTEVSREGNPDLVINISRIYNNSTGVIDYSNYYGGYYDYYDPFYWGYPGYGYYFPAVYGVYTITDGGINIDMFDAKNAAANNQLKLAWNGLIRGSGTFGPANITRNVTALFDQSPYLDAD